MHSRAIAIGDRREFLQLHLRAASLVGEPPLAKLRREGLFVAVR